MTESVNLTIALERGALRKAKVIAARNDTSVNAILRNYLEHLEDLGISGDHPASGNAETLFRYSMGLLPRATAMRELGISDYGLLIRMMGAGGLPLPTVSSETAKRMIGKFVRLVRPAHES